MILVIGTGLIRGVPFLNSLRSRERETTMLVIVTFFLDSSSTRGLIMCA